MPSARKAADVSYVNQLAFMVRRFALQYGSDFVWDMETGLQMKVGALRLVYGNDVVKAWLAHEHRRLVNPEEIVFDPSETCPEHYVNLFRGFEMQAKEGDCGDVFKLLYHLVADSAPTGEGQAEVVKFVMRWLALPLQKPGAKMKSALVFHGPQGTGKNLFFEIVASIYGRYAMVVGQDQLEDKFNDWASQKLFLIGDEVVARAELYHQKNRLKQFITGDTIQINAKMLPLRTERNHVNVVFLSNEYQPLALEEGDRRYLVVSAPPKADPELYAAVAKCLAGGGAAAFYHWLLALDLQSFTEHSPPPMTQAKRDLIELGLKPAERFYREWEGGHLPLPLHVCSTLQLYTAFKRWCSITGERFPPAQAVFTQTIKAIGRGRLVYKVCNLDFEDRGRKTTRCWLPAGTGPVGTQSEGQWAASAVEQFEASLAQFTQGVSAA